MADRAAQELNCSSSLVLTSASISIVISKNTLRFAVQKQYKSIIPPPSTQAATICTSYLQYAKTMLASQHHHHHKHEMLVHEAHVKLEVLKYLYTVV
eukprot:1860-Heterococcus_DN1.PRE.1